MYNRNTGSGRLVSSFNLGGNGAVPGTGAYHTYNNNGESKQVTKTQYTTYNTTYTNSRTTSTAARRK